MKFETENKDKELRGYIDQDGDLYIIEKGNKSRAVCITKRGDLVFITSRPENTEVMAKRKMYEGDKVTITF